MDQTITTRRVLLKVVLFGAGATASGCTTTERPDNAPATATGPS